MRNGVGPTRLRIPPGTRITVVEFLRARFPHLAEDSITRRINEGEIVTQDGSPITHTTAAADHEFIWYYRTVPDETPIPFDIDVLHIDDDLVVADKPHFLPTTPGGQFVQETALVRLRNQLNIPDLVPLHRLDRATAGVLLFSPNPATRGAYQQLFEHRRVTRSYRAVVHLPAPSELYVDRFPLTFRNRIIKTKGHHGRGRSLSGGRLRADRGTPNWEAPSESRTNDRSKCHHRYRAAGPSIHR